MVLAKVTTKYSIKLPEKIYTEFVSGIQIVNSHKCSRVGWVITFSVAYGITIRWKIYRSLSLSACQTAFFGWPIDQSLLERLVQFTQTFVQLSTFISTQHRALVIREANCLSNYSKSVHSMLILRIWLFCYTNSFPDKKPHTPVHNRIG